MNAVKPPVRRCTSRTRKRCSIRSAGLSPRPYIMATEVFIPWRWASSCTPRHSRDAKGISHPARRPLSQAVHHGDRCVHPLAVGLLLHAEPLVGLGLLAAAPPAALVHGTSADPPRNAVEARGLELTDDFRHA